MINFIEKDLKYYKNLAKKKDFKPLWVVSKMVEKWGAKVISKRDVIKLISYSLGVEGKKIKWFIDEVLKKPSK